MVAVGTLICELESSSSSSSSSPADSVPLLLSAYWLDFGVSYVDSSLSWRFPIALQILFAILLIGGVAVLPE